MSTSSNNGVSDASPALAARGSENEGGAELRHELAGLVDGSMRHLRSALRRLDGADASPLDNLKATQEALEQMAQLLRRTNTDSSALVPLSGSTSTLGQTVLHALRHIEPEARQHDVHLFTEFAPDTVALPAGPLRRVLDNALRNSIEAIATAKTQLDTPRHVTVTTARAGDELRLSIADTGPGLSPQVLNCKGGFRFGVSTKPQGSAMGMALMRRIAEQLGGALTVQPNTPRGVLVTLRCPAAALHEAHEPTATTEA